MSEIATTRLRLRPIALSEAAALLTGRRPPGLRFADDYPAQFSLEVMGMVVADGGPGETGPFFVVRASDDVVIGEIGCSTPDADGTGVAGYGLVVSTWNQGYATEALRAVLDHALAQPGMLRVVAQAPVGHGASRRVMEKAGMRPTGVRIGAEDGVEDGAEVELAGYEILRPAAQS